MMRAALRCVLCVCGGGGGGGGAAELEGPGRTWKSPYPTVAMVVTALWRTQQAVLSMHCHASRGPLVLKVSRKRLRSPSPAFQMAGTPGSFEVVL